ncbi:MAG: pantoate--beta-alanine ligase [Lentisphaerales bacterium]|nr:pantoate--beta-alanine ligase [Lentisphaerales bacterium]
MKVIETISDMQTQSLEWRRQGFRIGVVPTMGALHDGHLSLLELANAKADKTILTIFVNPTQFAPGEDLDKYPRTFEQDKTLCEEYGADAVFFPSVEEMYIPNASTWVNEEVLSQGYCGADRPTHFRGVTTIVTKLYNAVLPDVAVFGEKDYQQLQVLKKMTADLNFPIEVVPGKIWREESGLAMSSRNRYLSESEKEAALAIYKSLHMAADEVTEGTDLIKVRQQIFARIVDAGGKIDYVETVDSETLEAVDTANGGIRCLIAAHFGPARLLDNMQLN